MWSRDGNRAYRMGRAIKAGRVWTNCYHAYPAHAAFGGYKQSGIGRETHKMMLDHYQQTKNLLVSYSDEQARVLLTVVEKVIATAAAVELIELLKSKHGPGLMFHQSGGCCDDSAANCYLLGDFTIGAGDVYLGDIGGCCRSTSARHGPEYWRHTQLIIDVIEGHGGTFSLEGPEGKAFHTRSRVFTDAELAELDHTDRRTA